MPLYRNIPIFLPELACKNKCIFCNQQTISGTHSIPQPHNVAAIIEEHIATIPPNAHIQVAFFGGSFTGLPMATQIQYLQAVQPYISRGNVQGIRISTRPDYITHDIVTILSDYGVQEIELGVQSIHNDVLLASGRGHTVEHIEQAVHIIHNHKISLGLQMMIGLPGDTHAKAVETAQTIIDLGARSTRIYPTLVIAHTPLAELYKKGLYTPLSLDEAVTITKDIYRLFVSNSITVLRVGLHPSKDLHNPEYVLAGPFHHAFKELVETEIWWDIFEKQLPSSHKKIEIHVPHNQIQYAIGYNATNKQKLQKHFDSVNFIASNHIQEYECTYRYY
jgi:histone acetyltransferase (RNA polymerase elongator complex component)